MSWIKDLTDGVRALLTDAGITGVTIGQTTLGTAPDRLVALTPYLLEYDRSSGVCRVGMSIRFRVPASGGADALTDLQAAAFDVLADLSDTDLGGVNVARVEWWSDAPFGLDSKNRPEAVATYHITCPRQSRVVVLAQ